MAIDASQLDVTVEEKPRWRRTMKVRVPASVVSAERERVVGKLAGRMNLPGFRSGRVPTAVVERRHGPAITREVLDQILGDAYQGALASQSVRPISQGEVDEVDYEPEKDLSFSISFDVRPEIEVGRLGGFAIERPAPEVGPEDVDQVLQRLREQNGAWAPVEEGHPETGDLVSVSIRRLAEGEPVGEPQEYDLVLGEGDAIPDIESAIHTLHPGETDDFDVTFPDDLPSEELRGETQRLRITVTARKVRELPELDDSFAREVGDFESLQDLEARVRQDLESEARRSTESAVRRQLMDNLIEANPFDVPASMVDRYIESVLGDAEGVDPSELERAREQIRPEAERAVKRILLLERIARIKDLDVGDDELDVRIEEIAKANDATPSEVYAELQKSGRLEALQREMTEAKVFAFLEAQSEIVPAEPAAARPA